MTVNMKLDLAKPSERGLALGLNETAGYLAVAAAAFASGLIADEYGLRPKPFYLGIAFAAAALALSVLLIRDTTPPVAPDPAYANRPGLATAFADATWRRKELFGLSQAGFVNNLNDALAWGIFPLFFAARGLSLDRIGILAAAYPLAWGGLQVAGGWLSDVAGRKRLAVAGMLIQALSIALVAVFDSFAGWIATVALLGLGTAMAYPTLLAAVGDAVPPPERATTLGVYRFWRDGGAAAGALGAGAIADLFDLEAAILAVAALTAASAVVAAFTLRSGTSSS